MDKHHYEKLTHPEPASVIKKLFSYGLLSSFKVISARTPSFMSMSWYSDFNPWDTWRRDRNKKRNLDNDRSREKIKMIHILANHGAKWLPMDRSEIGDARRSLLYMSPDYTVEFIWIMSKYKACKPETLEELIRTPSIRSLISKHRQRIDQLIVNFQTMDALTSLPDPQADES